jgi:hypothetical protein
MERNPERRRLFLVRDRGLDALEAAGDDDPIALVE